MKKTIRAIFWAALGFVVSRLDRQSEDEDPDNRWPTEEELKNASA